MPAANLPTSPDDPLADVLAEYLQQLDASQAPDLPALRARHPHLARELDDFVAALQRIDGLARPLQDLLRAPGETVSLSPRDTDGGAPAAA
jgi:hypothetical protein